MDLEFESLVLDSVAKKNEVSKNVFSPESKDLLSNGGLNDETCGNGSGFTNSEKTKLEFSSSVKRGQGLRKWRRIRRDLSKGSDSHVNVSRHLLPDRANLEAGSSKRQVRVEKYCKAEGSSSSTNAVVRSFEGNVLVGDAGTDSESSKSSTAASVPKVMYDRATFGSNGKSTSGKKLTQSLQQGKGRNEETKKGRGNRGKIEKENSYSSVESDLRSSGFVFMQRKQFTSTGVYSEGSIGYDYDTRGNGGGYGRDGDRCYEEMSSEGVVGDSAWEVKVESTSGRSSSADQELLFALQSLPEALQREVLKFQEISKDIEETSEVVESSFKTAQYEVVETAFRHVEKELEDLFKEKIEAEVEYLVRSRKAETMGSHFVDQLTILEEQRALASEQTQILNKLEDAENKAEMLKNDAKKLEHYCEDIANVDETLQLQSCVFKYTYCFSVQLLVLVVIIVVFFSKLPTSSVEFVPT